MGNLAKNVLLISLLILSFGVILLFSSHVARFGPADGLPRAMLRDLGIALCSTGLISTAYEVLIRTQLLDDQDKRIAAVVNPDSVRLGIRRIFGSRGERADAGFGNEKLLARASSEIIVYGAAPLHILVDRRHRLKEFIIGGGTVRLLMSNVAGTNLDALDDTLATEKGSLRHDVEKLARAVQDLREDLRPSGSDRRLVVKCHDIVPPFNLLGIDLESAHAVFIIELNGVRTGAGDRPSFVLQQHHGGLYHSYRRQFDDLWERAAECGEVSRTAMIPHAERGVWLGLQPGLYALARELRKERKIKDVVYYHYSGAMLQAEITELLHDDVSVQLYIQRPETVTGLRVHDESSRIEDVIRFFRRLDIHQKSHLTVWQSIVPNTVRAAVFGDEFIVLSWYVYAALQARDDTTSLPHLKVRGHDSLGVLIECSNPAFVWAKDFLAQYRDGLSAKQLAL